MPPTRPVAYCGRCKRVVQMDAEWGAKYARAHPGESADLLIECIASADG